MNGRLHTMCLHLLLCGLLFIAPFRSDAQGNLVANHSFEAPIECWPFSGFYTLEAGPTGWFSGGTSPDYFQSSCGYATDPSAPLNHLGFQYAQDGGDYVGVITYFHPVPWREYVVIELIEPLVLGQSYHGSFYANAAWGGTAEYPLASLATNNIGMLFTMEPRAWVWGDPVPTTVGYAHIHYQNIISDTVAWTLVSGSFVADSAYRFLSIGNHFSNNETDTLPLGTTLNPPSGYSFIDNVCVSIDPEGCPMATNVRDGSMNGVAVFPNPATTEFIVSGVPDGSVAFITDAIGREVWKGRTTSGIWQIDVAEWPRGSYMVRLMLGDHWRSFKFVLME
jgi:hypothetical protein